MWDRRKENKTRRRDILLLKNTLNYNENKKNIKLYYEMHLNNDEWYKNNDEWYKNCITMM